MIFGRSGKSTRVADCPICGHVADGVRHYCPEVWAGTRLVASTVCPLGHDKQGKRNCPTCKSAYDRARYPSRRTAGNA